MPLFPTLPAGFDAAWFEASTSALAVCGAAGQLHWCNGAFERRFWPENGRPPADTLVDHLQLESADADALRTALRQPGAASLRVARRSAGQVPCPLGVRVLSLAAGLRLVQVEDAPADSSSPSGTGREVAEQRRTELALREAHESAALAARGAGLGTWSIDVESGVIRWDEQMWRLRRLPPQDGPPDFDAMLQVVHPDDRDAVARRVRGSQDTPAQVQSEFRIRWPDGTVRWLASRSAPVLDERGRVVRRIGVNWDITDTREAERARQERELAQHESRAKSDFLARMSHELRTPLNAIIGFTQLLLAEERAPDPSSAARRHRLQHIRGAGQQLLGLINDVLELGGLEGSEGLPATQPVVLEPLVADVGQTLAAAADEHGVQIQLRELGQAALADAARLRQVVRVLLARAIRQTLPGGCVSVSARREAGRVHLQIQDQGPAMSPQELREAFEPFGAGPVQDREAGPAPPAMAPAPRSGIEGSVRPNGAQPVRAAPPLPGSVLGLAMARTVIERMAGRLSARAAGGAGMVFEIDLPAASSDGPTTPPTGPATVLYIEDNPVNALIVSELIARRGDLELHVAATGAEGVALAEQLRPRLVLLDMQLPDFDGFEVMRRLRAMPTVAGTQVIALSANAMPHDIERALAAGISAYWTKPLDFAGFMQSLDALFGRAPAE